MQLLPVSGQMQHRIFLKPMNHEIFCHCAQSAHNGFAPLSLFHYLYLMGDSHNLAVHMRYSAILLLRQVNGFL